MPSRNPRDPKLKALHDQGCLNPHPQAVQDPLFADGNFFDPRDLLQVKYEMVRCVEVDGRPVRHSAAAFGFSRPSFYQAQALLRRGGLPALLPRKPGPRRAHKLGPGVVSFLRAERSADDSVTSRELARRVRKRFGYRVHPRSVERALARAGKKRP